MALHDLLQQGIKEYITNKNNCTNYTSPNNESSSYFHVHNGDISLEIHLADALRYFTGGSYLAYLYHMESEKQMFIDLSGQSYM